MLLLTQQPASAGGMPSAASPIATQSSNSSKITTWMEGLVIRLDAYEQLMELYARPIQEAEAKTLMLQMKTGVRSLDNMPQECLGPPGDVRYTRIFLPRDPSALTVFGLEGEGVSPQTVAQFDLGFEMEFAMRAMRGLTVGDRVLVGFGRSTLGHTLHVLASQPRK